ncbi:serine hydrolase domain-containing protein [Pseudoalteromonas sp.]|uniref:serine hydrolase domain-containing protein n=1 Tax=Pseudoalteromonas sp. TaxID=53249 RepID=UPI0035636BFF
MSLFIVRILVITSMSVALFYSCVTIAQSAFQTNINAFEFELTSRNSDTAKPNVLTMLSSRLADLNVPGAGVAVIENGELIWAHGFGTQLAGKSMPVDENTVFSVGSVSKMVNAALILRLVAEGKLDLDTDVNKYLKSWRVEQSRFSQKNKVTLRAILSHTAGFSQHGFADFQPEEELPTALQTLNGEWPAKHRAVRLMFTPGSAMDYSGGGTTVSQVMIEDVTGLSYPAAAEKYVFSPLGMTRSTFLNPLPASHGNIARGHNRYGNPTALPRGWEAMPEMAASGLWTSAYDLGLFLSGLIKSYHQKNGFIPQELIKDMMARVPNSHYGLGPIIKTVQQTKVFYHGGANDSYQAWLEGHLHSQSGIIILTNGSNGGSLFREIRSIADSTFNWQVTADEVFKKPKL